MLFGKSDASIRGGGFKRQGGVLSHFLPAKGWTHEPRVGGQSPQGLPSNCSPFGPFQTKNTEFYKREVGPRGGWQGGAWAGGQPAQAPPHRPHVLDGALQEGPDQGPGEVLRLP